VNPMTAAIKAAAIVPPPQQAEMTPTIQVTIGRIEIRATTASTPAQPRQTGPRLSLDEYLRRRNGGGK
jgi:hypothetical protein